jgi:SAM-dependent methyltransferase
MTVDPLSRLWPPAPAEESFFHLRTADLAFHRKRLRFDLARSLFASNAIDAGSLLLLRHLQSVPLDHARRVLDLGSGIGVLGVVLVALDPRRALTAVDRDALACRYTRRNLVLNELASAGTDAPAPARVLGSLGYDQLRPLDEDDRFDLIVSNLPGKAGASVIEHLIAGAAGVAAADAIVGFVVVRPLADLVTDAVAAAGYRLLLAKGNKTHQVVVAQITDPDPVPVPEGFAAGIYDRATLPLTHRSMQWRATTVTGLPEFDTLAYSTRMLRQALQGVPAGPAVIVNPGQGHRAVIAARSGYVPATLIGRDLLALAASRRCLVDDGLPPPDLIHDITVSGGLGVEDALVIMHADDKVHAPYFTDQVERVLEHLATVSGRRAGDLVLTGRAGLLGRLEADLLARRPGRIVHKASQRGFRALRHRVASSS